MKDSELVRLALIYAVQDREGFSECSNDEAAKEAGRLAKAFRAYHKRRFGGDYMTELERDVAQASVVSVFSLMRAKEEK